MTKFVRITYMECFDRDGKPGYYEAVGIKQDIRLKNGYFEISDDHGAVRYNIVAGKLHRIGEKDIRVANEDVSNGACK